MMIAGLLHDYDDDCWTIIITVIILVTLVANIIIIIIISIIIVVITIMLHISSVALDTIGDAEDA